MLSTLRATLNSASLSRVQSARPSRGTRGFTLIELLVSMAIIGVLVALLIPAVQSARESARRTRCLSNLHQLGVAFHSYHETYKQLPPVYVALHNTIVPNFLGVEGPKDDLNVHTYGECLLPFLDQAPLFQKINFSQPHFSPADLSSIGLPNYTADNQSVVATPLPVFLCPSSPRQENPHSYTWTGDLPIPVTYRSGGNDYGPSNGIVVFSPIMSFAPPQEGDTKGEGILSNNIPNASFRHVQDGLTSTSLMWEIAGRPALWQKGQRIAGSTVAGGGWADLLNAECWFEGTQYDGSAGPGPCAINCSNRFEGSTYSFHPLGVHVLLCDGSAKLLNENLNVGIFAQLVTYHGNTSVGEF